MSLAMQKEMNQITALFTRGDFKGALSRCKRLVEKHPKDAKVRFAHATICLKAGDTRAAIDSYRATLKLEPNHLHALVNLGGLLFTEQRYADACPPLRKALTVDPANFLARMNLAQALYGDGRLEESLEHARKARTLNANSVEAHSLILKISDDLDQFEHSLDSARRLASLRPNDLDSLGYLAANLGALGKFEERELILSQALENMPDEAASIHVMLSEGRRDQAMEAESIEVLENSLNSGTLTSELEIHAGFALAKLFDRAKEYDKSFAVLSAANEKKRQIDRFDSEGATKHLEDLKQTFTRDFYRERKGWGDPSTQPLFVLGMPRSGTTLTEQLLSSHPDVVGFGERGLFELICNPTLSVDDYIKNLMERTLNLTKSDVRTYGKNYLRRVSALDHKPVFAVDKTPSILHAGLIALVFPNAQILCCRRDPIDVCLSNFQQDFKMIPGTNSLEDLAHRFNIHQRALCHFLEVLPTEIKFVDYEHLVSDPDGASAYVHGLVGLGPSTEDVNHAAGTQGVRTASIWQVRQPIYNTSVQKWRRYEKHLGPLIARLAPYLDDTNLETSVEAQEKSQA